MYIYLFYFFQTKLISFSLGERQYLFLKDTLTVIYLPLSSFNPSLISLIHSFNDHFTISDRQSCPNIKLHIIPQWGIKLKIS